MRLLICILFAGVSLPLAAEKDFLTADEADQIREAQEPNARLQLYVGFARQRIAMVEQLLAKEKAGRSALIHEALDEYNKIVEAIDVVSDDSLRKKKDVTAGAAAVAKAEQEMLAKLEKFKATKTRDFSRYEDSLANAIENTGAGIELAQMDVADRSKDVQKKDASDKKAAEALMTPAELDAKQAEEKKAAAEAAATEAPKKKAPTLRRKGEVVNKP